MPIFERPPLDSLTPARDRWTPIYLEKGRLEVDDASVKWIGADGFITRLPVATLSALILGPGTTLTHAAIKTCAQSNCPVFWMGEDGMRFYAFGITPNHDNSMARLHADAWAHRRKRAEVARRMFLNRFPEARVQGLSIQQLRGMEGRRVKATYAELGSQFGVIWKGRDYKTSNWSLADGINRALSASNASLYALTAAVCCSMGFLPQLGFVHQAGTLPFIYDAADLYKHQTSWPAAFEALSIDPKDDGSLVRKILKRRIEETRMLRRMPDELKKLFDNLPGQAPDECELNPLQPRSDA
ncbi:CRISPR-associated protein Cas1 [Haloferula luteola]|uniref:CRISPR-associated endonuclease Cas1 n=1 Tax=Haloferula luteola TaxID=595692 RepID=A0A840V0T5_9BACT|nr:CRISPR-associated protein Cas1 [Haloferula luteola]